MTDDETKLFAAVLAEIAALKTEVAQLRALSAPPADDTICLKDASRISGYSDEQVRQWLTQGADFGRKVGGRWQVDAGRFKEWLAARNAGSARA